MKKLLLLISLISAFRICSAQSELKQKSQAQQELFRRGEVYFSFQLNDPGQIVSLSKTISISSIEGNTVFAYANQNEFSEFTKQVTDYRVLTAPSELNTVQMTNDPRQVLTWNYYPTYSAYENLMQQFASDHPDICKLITITTLASGRKILALRISDNPGVEENEPEFLYSSTMHGDEVTGYILMLHLADYILNGYGTDKRITKLVNNFDVVICPLANPDGTYKGGNNNVNGATRSNANNIDLNRNYPDPAAGLHPDGNAWQSETVAFMDFAKQNTFTMGANFHGGAEVVNYPWDTWSRLTADNAWWYYTSRAYADTVHANSPAGYMTYLNNGITDGYAWYTVTGGRQDYMSYYRYCREVTIELSNTKILPENQLLAYWNYNYRSLLNYIEQAGYGLHGLVTDSLTGEPLYAKVYISGFDKDSSHVYTDAQVGDYHRLLKSDNYTVTYSANGHLPKSFAVQVADKQTTVLNVRLNTGTLGTGFKKQSEISVYPNPAINEQVTVKSDDLIQKIIVKDITGRVVTTLTPLTSQTSVDCNWPSGNYFFQIEVKGSILNKKIQVIRNK